MESECYYLFQSKILCSGLVIMKFLPKFKYLICGIQDSGQVLFLIFATKGIWVFLRPLNTFKISFSIYEPIHLSYLGNECLQGILLAVNILSLVLLKRRESFEWFYFSEIFKRHWRTKQYIINWIFNMSTYI